MHICTYLLVFDSIIIIFDDTSFKANLPTSFFAGKKNVVGIAPELPETYDGSQQGAFLLGIFLLGVLGEIDAQSWWTLPIFQGMSCHWIWELIARFDTMSSKRPPFWTHWQKGGGQGLGCWRLDPNCLILYRKDMFFQSYQFCRYIHLCGLNYGMLTAIYLHQDILPLPHFFCIKVMKTDRKQIGLWTGLRSTSEDLDDWC